MAAWVAAVVTAREKRIAITEEIFVEIMQPPRWQ
jgi:hypothetical protein